MVILFYIIFVAFVCGNTPRIVGGDEVDETTSFPWLVAIVNRNVTLETDTYNNRSDYFNRQFCGGSIINESWILTAAHCLEDVAPNQVAIVAATYNLSTTMGQLRWVSDVIIHEYYNSTTVVNDIALLELEEPLVLNSNVAVILPATTDDPVVDGQIYTLAGWGAINKSGTEYSPILKTVTVPGVSVEDCGEVLDNIYDTNLCAGGVDGEDSCSGDSGGPMTMTVDSVEILYGIVSWGLSICATANPAVYTAVSMYRDWIEENSGLSLGNEDASSDDNTKLYMIIGIVVGIVVVIMLLAMMCRLFVTDSESGGVTAI